MRTGPLLFVALFSTQASLIALTPTLPQVAAEFGVSTAAAGQLRAVTGLVAGMVSIVLGAMRRRHALRSLLVTGLRLLALGSILSAAAPTFAVLAVAQVVIGAGVATVLASAVAASFDWSPPGARSKTLSLALLGQPMAWVVGLPFIGIVGGHTWRVGWIMVPLASSLGALAALRRHPDDGAAGNVSGSWRRLVARRDVQRWAVGELLAFGAWSGALIYAGALFVDAHGLSPGRVGTLLGIAALAYVPGNLVVRRWIDAGGRPPLEALALLAAISVVAFGTIREQWWMSVVLFATLVAIGGGRTLAGSAAGLALCPDQRLDAMAVRTAATQFGYLLGASVGGLALATFGYAGLAVALALLFGGASIAHGTRAPEPRRLEDRTPRGAALAADLS